MASKKALLTLACSGVRANPAISRAMGFNKESVGTFVTRSRPLLSHNLEVSKHASSQSRPERSFSLVCLSVCLVCVRTTTSAATTCARSTART